MTISSKMSLNAMLSMRRNGAAYEEIAAEAGLKPMTVYQRLRRTAGIEALRQVPEAANDNHPDRVTRMVAWNGGCSTTSGRVPVTLARIPTLDGPALEVAA